MTDIRRIIHASDFSPASQVAFAHALRLAQLTGAELTILHVLPSPISGFVAPAYVPSATWEEIRSGMRAEADKEMDRLVKQAVDGGVRAHASILDAGNTPGDDIVRVAQDTKADMLVLGTHGRSGMAKFFLGSVAARVVATATCAVLTVRTPEPGQERP